MKLIRKAGDTSTILQIFVQDSSSTVGAGLTGLVFNSGSMTAYYHRDTDTTATSMALVTMTVGTFTSLGFKEIDATNMPGWYQFCPPDAALASGAKSVAFHLKGATNMAPVVIECQLIGADVQSPWLITSQGVKKNTALAAFPFAMYSSTGAPVTGLGTAITVQRSLDGAAWGTATNSGSATEIGNGMYVVSLSAGDLNGNTVGLRFSGSGAVDTLATIITVQA